MIGRKKPILPITRYPTRCPIKEMLAEGEGMGACHPFLLRGIRMSASKFYLANPWCYPAISRLKNKSAVLESITKNAQPKFTKIYVVTHENHDQTLG